MATPLDPALMKDPVALRTAIISRLGIDPKKLVAFGGGPAFDDQIRNLYRTATGKYGALDLQEARAGQDYENNLSLMNQAQKRDSRILGNDLADRGLGFSGAAIRRRAQLGQDYANRLQTLNTAKTRGLEDVGTARNEAINSLLSGRSAYEADYTKQLQDWLQQQSQAAAQSAIGQPVTTPMKTVTKTVTHPTATTPKKTQVAIKSPVQQKAVRTSSGVTGYRPTTGGVTNV